jgi:hypothetical protein
MLDSTLSVSNYISGGKKVETSKYDLAVAYRIYPKVSKVPLVFADDKYHLAKLCLQSFKRSLGPLKAKIFVLLDNCPGEYEELFKSLFDEQDLELLHLSGIGNNATFEMQMQLLLDQTDADVVYFAEDDYLYMPDQFGSMISFLNSNSDVDFISPYDHLDYYTLDLHNHPNKIRIDSEKHWRTANSTCLTFLTQKKTLEKTYDTFMSYTKGNYDASLWLSLTKFRIFNIPLMLQYRSNEPFLYDVLKNAWIYNRKQILFNQRFSLWVPVPSIATHIEKAFLAPNVDWGSLLNEKKNDVVAAE